MYPSAPLQFRPSRIFQIWQSHTWFSHNWPSWIGIFKQLTFLHLTFLSQLKKWNNFHDGARNATWSTFFGFARFLGKITFFVDQLSISDLLNKSYNETHAFACWQGLRIKCSLYSLTTSGTVLLHLNRCHSLLLLVAEKSLEFISNLCYLKCCCSRLLLH